MIPMIMKMKKEKNNNSYNDLFITEDDNINKQISKSLKLPKINYDIFFENREKYGKMISSNITDITKSINFKDIDNNDKNKNKKNIIDEHISKRFNNNNKNLNLIGRRDTSLNNEIIKDMDKLVGIKEKKEKDEKKKMENDERQIFILYEENDEIDEIDSEQLNNIAQIVLDRIQDKLSGTDFNPDIIYDVKNQVNELIKSATSYENLAQSYLGWCPFW
jgi:hypothetical protein